jgi:putative hemolysin
MEIAFLLLLIVANGVFVMSEFAVVSARKTRLQAAADRGNPRAAAALALAESPTRFLSTVQAWISLIGITIGAFGEAALSTRLEASLKQHPSLAPYAGAISLVVVVLAITYVSLVIGELVPKRIGMGRPETIATVMARPMLWMSRLAAPIVWFLSASTDLIVGVMGLARPPSRDVTAEDIKGIIEQAAETGVVYRAEQEMVEGVLRLGDRKVKALMVPRTEIEFLDVADPPQRVRIAVATSFHSQYPVCRAGLDDVVGILHVKDIVKHGLISDTLNLEEIARPPLFVPESTHALKLLETFKNKGTHMALVVDEYGAVEGLITFNDIVEAVIGDVYRPGQDSEPLIVQRSETSWLLGGSLPIDQLQDLMQTDALPGGTAATEGSDYHTLGGLVMTHLGHIPRTAETFEWGDFRFEVVDMDGQRVDKVMLTRLPPPSEAQTQHSSE